ncbi:MAG: HAD family phosphatase [Clostridia bacterium]|nr:HAD family phosphatase [Clostridia bacterium]
MKINAAIFDMDGVIFDTERLWRDAFVLSTRRFNLPLTEADRQLMCGKTEPVIRAELRRAFPSLDADAYRDSMIDYVRAEIAVGRFSLKEGFLSLMDTLRSRGIRTALATSSHRDRAYSLFEKKGLSLDYFFPVTVFSEEVGDKSKPNPYMFCLAAEKLGLTPTSCCVVEDSINGIVAATRGGFMPIMAVDLIEPDAFCNANARVVRNLEEVKRLL